MDIEQKAALARDGDRDAFVLVVKHLENSLYHTARSIVRREEDVADALQETILKAYKSLHTLREPSFFKTWMFRILINECNSILKKRARNVPTAEVPERSGSSREYDNVELREAVDQLDEQQRIVIVLYYFEDMPLKQVAEALNLSESAVKMRLSRARNTLLDKLTFFSKGTMNYESI